MAIFKIGGIIGNVGSKAGKKAAGKTSNYRDMTSEDVDKTIAWNMNPFLKELYKLKKATTENANIVITAIGTAVFSTLVIAFNPMSKTDKETKQYTAMRQPISAVLSVITQCGVVIALSNYLKKLINTGKLGHDIVLNRSTLHDREYFEKLLKKERKKLTPKEFENRVNACINKEVDDAVTALIKDKTIKIQGKAIDSKIFNKIMLDALNDVEKQVDNLELSAEKIQKQKNVLNSLKEQLFGKSFDYKKAEELGSAAFSEKINLSLDSIREALEKVGIKDIDKNIIDKYKNFASNKAKLFIKMNSILIGLAILPATCWTLNWIYPRFMKAFFPSLINGKKDADKKAFENLDLYYASHTPLANSSPENIQNSIILQNILQKAIDKGVVS